jgi:hypothetical protein
LGAPVGIEPVTGLGAAIGIVLGCALREILVGNKVGNSDISIAGISVGASVGLADRFIVGWIGAAYGELVGNAPSGEPAGRSLGGMLGAAMGTVGFTLNGRFEAPIGADEMLGTSICGAALGISVGSAVGEKSLDPLFGAAEGAMLGFPYGRAVQPGDWIGDHAGLTTGVLPTGPCTTMVGSSVSSVDGNVAGALFGTPTGATRGARGCNGCIGPIVVDGTSGLGGLAGELPVGLLIGRSKPWMTGAPDPGGSGRGTRGSNGCIGAFVRDKTTGDVGLARLTGELPMGRTGLAVGRLNPCGTGPPPMGNVELGGSNGTGANATVGLAGGDAVGVVLAGLRGVAVGELLLGKLCIGASGTVPPLVPSPAGAAVRMVVGALGTSTTGLCVVGETGFCLIGAMGLIVILTAEGATGLVALPALAGPTGLAVGNATVEGAVAVLLSGAARGTGTEALDWVPSGGNVDGAIGVRSSLRAFDDKVGVDAGAMVSTADTTAGLDPMTLGDVGGARLALVWDGAMGFFSIGEAVGWSNVSK